MWFLTLSRGSWSIHTSMGHRLHSFDRWGRRVMVQTVVQFDSPPWPTWIYRSVRMWLPPHHCVCTNDHSLLSSLHLGTFPPFLTLPSPDHMHVTLFYRHSCAVVGLYCRRTMIVLTQLDDLMTSQHIAPLLVFVWWNHLWGLRIEHTLEWRTSASNSSLGIHWSLRYFIWTVTILQPLSETCSAQCRLSVTWPITWTVRIFLWRDPPWPTMRNGSVRHHACAKHCTVLVPCNPASLFYSPVFF